MAKYCVKCGAQMTEDSVFCGSCGTPVAQAGVPAPREPQQPDWAHQQTQYPAYYEEYPAQHRPPQYARTGIGAGRWVVIVCSAILLLCGVLPIQGSIWLDTAFELIPWWAMVAIPAVAAIAISVYAKKRAQLAAAGFLLVAFVVAIRLLVFFGHDWSSWGPDDLAAVYVAAIFAIFGAICALVNGLSAPRREPR